MIRTRFAVLATALSLAVGVSARPALAQTWTFEDFPLPPFGVPIVSPLSQAKGGITATFLSSSIVPLGEFNFPSPTLTGNVLFSNQFGAITFSQAVSGMNFQWAMVSRSATTQFGLHTFLGGIGLNGLVSSTAYTGSAVTPVEDFFVIQGSASYSGSAFDAVAYCAFDAEFLCDVPAAPLMYLDNVSVSTVPEPMTVSLMAAGLAGLGIVARRRRRALVA